MKTPEQKAREWVESEASAVPIDDASAMSGYLAGHAEAQLEIKFLMQQLRNLMSSYEALATRISKEQ